MIERSLDKKDAMRTSAREIFGAVADLPAKQRADYLALHASDESLRLEVEALLAADRNAELVIDREVKLAARRLFFEPAEMRLGPYRTLKLLGRGGMGSVYLAERADGEILKHVAIKVVHPGMEATGLLERFHTERQILAGLDHPGIAALYDAGATADGRPWFAMEYVNGEPIDAFAEARQLDVPARVHLFLQVLEAVDYAHRHAVIHRDLKPANILVPEDGQPRLLDFGIARVLDRTNQAGAATRILTPEFAAPEQVRGEAVTTATDTYLAGGVLYKLLTGANLRNLDGATAAQAERLICEQDAIAPRELNAALDRDLENIVQMALRREPERRYSSVAALALDLKRYLEGQPVSATPDSAGYRARRFVLRHRISVAAAAFCICALVGGIAATAWQAAVARRHFQEVRTLANSFLFDFENEIHDLPGATKARSLVLKTAQQYLDKLYLEAKGDAGLTRELAESYDRLAKLQGGRFAGNTGEEGAAITNYQKAIALRVTLGDGRSTDPKRRRTLGRTYANLANTLVNAGRGPEAKAAGQAAVSNAENFLQVSGSEDAVIAANTAYATYASVLGVLSEARPCFEYYDKAVRLADSWEASHPGQRANRIRRADILYNLAQFQDLFGDYRASAATAKRALIELEALLAKGRTPQLQRLRILTGAQYGKALAQSGPQTGKEQRDEVLRQLRDAVSLATERSSKDPANALALNDKQYVRSILGSALVEMGDPAAIPVLEETKREVSARLENAPDDFDAIKILVDIHNGLSDALLRSRPAGALEEAAAAVRMSETVIAASPRDAVANKAKVIALLAEAEAQKSLGRSADALQTARLAVKSSSLLLELSPSDASAQQLADRAKRSQSENTR